MVGCALLQAAARYAVEIYFIHCLQRLQVLALIQIVIISIACQGRYNLPVEVGGFNECLTIIERPGNQSILMQFL